MENELYYDFNRKEVIMKNIIQNYYGLNCPEDLREINIYPIIDKKEIPEGWKENPIASIEELINESPLYVHDENYAWRIYRLYKDEIELYTYKDLQLRYIFEIEPLWQKKDLKSLNVFEKIIQIAKICWFLFKN